ncbi:MAG: chalcone isomerase family protein [Burkholderiales bacterium]|nr:chalcone isomerase family protein [Burkholderiales bacterium]
MRYVASMLFALALAAGAQAAEVGGVKLADKVSVGGQDLVLNGAGIRTKVIFKVYVGSLYVPAKAATAAAVYAKGPRRVQLNMLRDVGGEDMMEALSDGISQSNSAAEAAAVKAQSGELAAILKSIGSLKEGNVLTFDYVDGGTRVGLNGQAKGTIAGEAFNKALTNVWIGDKPAQDDLKKAMLGG